MRHGELVGDLLREFRELVIDLEQEHCDLKEVVTRRLPTSRCQADLHNHSSPSSSPFSSIDTATADTLTSTEPTTVNTVSSGTNSSSRTVNSRAESTLPPSYNTVVPLRPARTRRRTTSSELTNPSSKISSSGTTMSGTSVARGALIVFEGLDRVGKSTLAKKLVEHLERMKRPVAYLRFPDRTTSVGHLINEQLVKKSSKEIDNRAFHLLFSANRWELDATIRNTISKGTTVVLDRYSYTGIAYSSTNTNISMDWCCQVETGLPKPDMVVYLELPKEAQYKRPGFGDELFETIEFQESVRAQYEKLIRRSKEEWLRLDVEDKSPDQLLGEIVIPVKRCIEKCINEPLGNLSFI